MIYLYVDVKDLKQSFVFVFIKIKIKYLVLIYKLVG